MQAVHQKKYLKKKKKKVQAYVPKKDNNSKLVMGKKGELDHNKFHEGR